MPLQQSLPTWVALNAADDISPSGINDIRTNDPQFAGGLNAGDYFDITESEAKLHSYTTYGILHAGRYRRVQLHANATAANQGIGRLGFMPTVAIPTGDGQSGINVVTTIDQGAYLAAATLAGRIVIFLNVITPGNYGFIQELGLANVYFAAAATGVGTVVTVGTLGSAATGGTTAPFGVLLSASVPAGQRGLVALNLPVFQD
jgi:hypothetical protein